MLTKKESSKCCYLKDSGKQKAQDSAPSKRITGQNSLWQYQ